MIELTSELSVILTDHMGSDMSVIKSARVSTQTEPREGDEKLINYLIRELHASPFESCTVQFLFEVPIFTAREHMRHRVQAFNERSGRYSELKGKFYIPTPDRPLKQQGKVGAYTFLPGTKEEVSVLQEEIELSCQTAWDSYQRLLQSGVAKELARMVLPVNIFTEYYATANLRGWLNYLSLRCDPTAMYEIRETAFMVENHLHTLYPWTMNSWVENGRRAL